jgi:lipopolysaccharide/colanic/teichoic acid biosynthesis glycosyltransferase
MRTIAIISHQAFSLLNFRSSLIQLLAKSGYRVYALAPDYQDADIEAIQKLGAEPLQYSLSRTGVNPLKDFIDTTNLAAVLRSLQPDVTLSFTVKPNIYGSIAAWCAKVPNRISMIEGLGYFFTVGQKKISWSRRALQPLLNFLYRTGLFFSTTVIFLNRDDIDLFKSYGLVNANKVVNLGGIGVNLKDWTPEPLVKSPITFLFVGRLLREKGIYEFVEAIKIIHNEGLSARFVVLGGIDSNPGALNEDQIKAWVEDDLFEWPGHVDVKEWIEQSSVFVLPSYREGVPRSAQEAMAMGRPVITTDVPGCRDTVIDGQNGYLIPPFDAEALANAFKKFINDPESIEAMGKQSRFIAEREFDVEKKDLQLLEIINQKRLMLSPLKRFFDIALASLCILIFIVPIGVIWLIIPVLSKGPALYWSPRVGRNGVIFSMPKFRSMKIGTPVVGSDILASSAENFLIPGGSLLRRSSLDELPQIWSILVGDMSFVGPRPALYNQDELICARHALGIDCLRPGLTGWAQVNGRDEIPLERKVQFDAQYLQRCSFSFDLHILWLTFLKVIRRENISH